MFSNPTTGGGLDIELGKYYVKVLRLEDVPDGQFGPQIKWIFELRGLDGQPMLDERGLESEFWAWTSTSLSGGTKQSVAFKWGTVLMPGTDVLTLTGAEFSKMVIGKKAVALIGPNDTGKTRILSMSPMPAQKAAAGKAPAKAAPTPPEEPPDDADAIENQVAESAEAVGIPW